MEQLKARFLRHAIAMGLPPSIEGDYDSIYEPTLQWIRQMRTRETPFVLGINGAQGSGKSTFCALLKHLLDAQELKTVVLSIDDLYHLRKTRLEMARRIHPLCAIRGVPGTHDVELGIDILTALKTTSRVDDVLLPRFDKARDDRCPTSEFEMVEQPIDVVLFEGWCVGEPPLQAYEGPYNSREHRDDPDGIWARWSENALKTVYQDLNAMLDAILMIKVPSMEVVRQSRWLQEQKLHQRHSGSASNGPLPGLMSKTEVFEYVALFERHTEHMFTQLVENCDVLIERDEHFHYRLVRI